MVANDANSVESIWQQIVGYAQSLGFSSLGVVDLSDMSHELAHMTSWCEAGYHGEMQYLQQHIPLKADPTQLLSGASSILMVTMPYLTSVAWSATYRHAVEHPENGRALISGYALGRDYHKVLRQRLKKLAAYLQTFYPEVAYRVFVDSGPIMEVPYAEKAGLGWRGKHTLLLNRKGSWFFIGSMLLDVPAAHICLPIKKDNPSHCGSCQRCVEVCPTQAILSPYQLDARRCISYLTIEYQGSIPVELRPLIGTRIYGCDDCQAYCPWNRFAQPTACADFSPRSHLEAQTLLSVWEWTESTFLTKTEGSAMRRIGYRQWLRNIAVAMGNVPYDPQIRSALLLRLQEGVDPLVAEHIEWALTRQSSS